MKYVDLFCGLGSFHYSFRKLGFECVMACDISAVARSNYRANFGMDVLGDICAIDPVDLEAYDVLCAGFPCQPFSRAGRGAGFGDSRGSMFSHVMRFVRENVPKVVILENVPGLLRHDGGKSFGLIVSELEGAGYVVLWRVLKCSDYGIPQMRKRLFIVAFAPAFSGGRESFLNFDAFVKPSSLSEYLCRNFSKDVAYTLRCGGRGSAICDRHNWDGYFVDGVEYRLSIEDGLKLQGFEDYSLCGTKTERWKLLGNTIPTIFTELIGKKLVSLFWSVFRTFWSVCWAFWSVVYPCGHCCSYPFFKERCFFNFCFCCDELYPVGSYVGWFSC